MRCLANLTARDIREHQEEPGLLSVEGVNVHSIASVAGTRRRDLSINQCQSISVDGLESTDVLRVDLAANCALQLTCRDDAYARSPLAAVVTSAPLVVPLRRLTSTLTACACIERQASSLVSILEASLSDSSRASAEAQHVAARDSVLICGGSSSWRGRRRLIELIELRVSIQS